MATAERHTEISDRFLRQAEAEFRKGDMLQASEKAWGAVAHFVRAVAEQQGWISGSHRDTNRNALELIRVTPNPDELKALLGVVNSLHANFYEDFYEREMVESGIEAAGVLIAEMRAVQQNGRLRA